MHDLPDTTGRSDRHPRRRWVGGVAAVALTAAAGAAPAAAAPPGGAPEKVELCHADGTGGYHLLSVSVHAEQRHRDNHGDGRVGDPVPGAEEMDFGADCVPVARAGPPLVRAVSHDGDGLEVLIAQLEDTDGSGDASVGDTVRTAQYPQDLAASSFGSFGVTTFTVATVVADGSRDVEVVDGAGNSFRWEVEEFVLFDLGEVYEECTAAGTCTQIMDGLDFGPLFGFHDTIEVATGSPSQPADAPSESAVGIDDDAFLDLDFAPVP